MDQLNQTHSGGQRASHQSPNVTAHTVPPDTASPNIASTVGLETTRAQDIQESLEETIRRLEQLTASQPESPESPIGARSAPTMQSLSEHAALLNDLGQAYLARNTGNRRVDVEHAQSCFRRARDMYATLRSSAPATDLNLLRAWGVVHNNLGNANLYRIEGERVINLRLASECFDIALTVFDERVSPFEWATARHNQGLAYLGLAAFQQEAPEQALTAFSAAARAFETLQAQFEWATAQNNLGAAYSARSFGDREENLERAAACQRAALTVFTADAYPREWALTQTYLGTVYQERRTGDKQAFIESAIACYASALDTFVAIHDLRQQISTHMNLGAAYSDRIAGNVISNLHQSLDYYAAVERLCPQTEAPNAWASVRNNAGSTHLRLAIADPAKRDVHLAQAIICFQDALLIYTRDTSPREHRLMLWNLGNAYAHGRQWREAHMAYSRAQAVEDLQYEQGLGLEGRDAVRSEHWDASVRDAYCLLQLGQVSDAITTLEGSRARELARAWALRDSGNPASDIDDSSDPSEVSEPSQARYDAALQRLQKAESALLDPSVMTSRSLQVPTASDTSKRLPVGNAGRHLSRDPADPLDAEAMATLRAAQLELDAARVALQTAAQMEPLSAKDIAQVASQTGLRHGILYLFATPWGGAAVGAVGVSSPTDEHVSAKKEGYIALDLPQLTYDLATDLIEVPAPDGSNRPIGGIAYAQEGLALTLLWRHWRADTIRQQVTRLRAAAIVGGESTLLAAVEWALTIPELQAMADIALDALDDHDLNLLAHTIDSAFLQLELERVSWRLGTTTLGPVATWLQRENVAEVTLIPCGWLAAIPFTALPLPDEWSDSLGARTLGDLMPSSVAPSARALLIRKASGSDRSALPTATPHMVSPRSGIFAVGNPHPTHQDLPWGEAEALATVHIARSLSLPASVRIQEMATRDWFLDKLGHGAVVVAACHGSYLTDAPLRSGLRLAHRMSLTLADILTSGIDLRGLRLVTLSACQSANAHLRGPTDEVRGLATALLQSGARAVLASLWPVDDEATFLLMTRFVSEWLPHMDDEAPASALARAQRWLRSISNHDLQRWQIELSRLDQDPTSSATYSDSGGIMVVRTHAGAHAAQPMSPSRRATQHFPLHHEPEHDPTLTPVRTIRGVGDRYQLVRYDIQQASEEVRQHAGERSRDTDGAIPFADMLYWSAFQVYGW